MASKVVVLEEHFSHPELLAGMPLQPIGERLLDLGEGRLRAMDEAGIDLQVLSHFPSGPQNLPAPEAVDMARRTNQLISDTVAARPERFAGFASLPMTAPQEACAELERAVKTLGLKGAMLHGMAAGTPLDDRRFWPVFQTAEALDVPIYIHPDAPPKAVAEAYYQGFPALIGPGWSYTVESATQALRLMICGLLDECPRLKLILGHMGESLPFSIVRCDSILTQRANLKRRLVDYFHDHFWITTAANWSDPALVCTLMEMGPERILFSVDWPFASNTEGRAFLDRAPISERDRARILGENAVALLKL
ncbi:MAG TPA: amidohydrolase family protein [Caulobacteraceae bacterium]